MSAVPINPSPPDPERIRSDLMLLLREFSTELAAANSPVRNQVMHERELT